MDILIGFLLLVVGGIVFASFKFMSDDDKRSKTMEDAKGKRITDLETDVGQKDAELKKALAEVQRLEEEFYKAKDEADIAKKDVSELQAKLKGLEKDKDEVVELKNDNKQKEHLFQQETVTRQKLQGEISLKDLEIEKKSKEVEQLQKEVEKITSDFRDKSKMLDGLKGQYNEMEAELQKVRMAQTQETSKASGPVEMDEPSKASMPSKAPELSKVAEPPKAPEPSRAPQASEPVKIEEPSMPPKASMAPKALGMPELSKPSMPSKPLASFEPVEPPKPQPPASAEVKINQGFGFTKAELRQGVPSDTDFLKANPPQKPADVVAEIPDGAFKLTNVNKPQGVAPVDEKKDKSKSKRETLVPGFQPREKNPPVTP